MHQFVKQNMHTFSCFQRFWSDFFRFCALKFYLCVADPWYKYLKCSSGQGLSRDVDNMGIRCTQTKICALIEKTHVESRIGFQFSNCKKCGFLYRKPQQWLFLNLWSACVFLFRIMKVNYVQFEASKNITTKWGRCLDV